MFSTAFEHETKKGQLIHPSVSGRAERCSLDPSPCPDFLSGFDAEHLPVSSIASRLGTKVQQRLDNGPQTTARCSCRFALSLQLWSLCKQVRRKQPACRLAKIKHLERKVMSEESWGLQQKRWAGMHTPYIHVQPPSKGFHLAVPQHPLCRPGATMLPSSSQCRLRPHWAGKLCKGLAFGLWGPGPAWEPLCSVVIRRCQSWVLLSPGWMRSPMLVGAPFPCGEAVCSRPGCGWQPGGPSGCTD